MADNEVLGALRVSQYIIVAALPGQTADLMRWASATGVTLAKIRNDGLVATPFVADTNDVGPFIALTGTGVVVWNRGGVGQVPLTVGGMPAQSGDLQRWIDSSANVLGRFDYFGNFWLNASGSLIAGNIQDPGVNGPYINLPGSTVLFLNRGNVGYTPVIVRGLSGQTGDLQQWQDNTGVKLLGVGPKGAVDLVPQPNPGLPASGSRRLWVDASGSPHLVDSVGNDALAARGASVTDGRFETPQRASRRSRLDAERGRGQAMAADRGQLSSSSYFLNRANDFGFVPNLELLCSAGDVDNDGLGFWMPDRRVFNGVPQTARQLAPDYTTAVAGHWSSLDYGSGKAFKTAVGTTGGLYAKNGGADWALASILNSTIVMVVRFKNFFEIVRLWTMGAWALDAVATGASSYQLYLSNFGVSPYTVATSTVNISDITDEHFIAVTVGGTVGSAKLYIDGVDRTGTVNGSLPASTTGTSLIFGQNWNTNANLQDWAGQRARSNFYLSAVGVWSRAVDADHIERLCNPKRQAGAGARMSYQAKTVQWGVHSDLQFFAIEPNGSDQLGHQAVVDATALYLRPQVARVGARWMYMAADPWTPGQNAATVLANTDFSKLDSAVYKYLAKGITPLVMLLGMPPGINPGAPGGIDFQAEFFIPAYGSSAWTNWKNNFYSFVRAVMARYKGLGLMYEAWNEPNYGGAKGSGNTGFWQYDSGQSGGYTTAKWGSQFAELANNCYFALYSDVGDYTAEICTGGVLSYDAIGSGLTGTEFLHEVIVNQGLNWEFKHIGIHPYDYRRNGPAKIQVFQDAFQSLRQLSDDLHTWGFATMQAETTTPGVERDIWATEWGYANGPDVGSGYTDGSGIFYSLAQTIAFQRDSMQMIAEKLAGKVTVSVYFIDRDTPQWSGMMYPSGPTLLPRETANTFKRFATTM